MRSVFWVPNGLSNRTPAGVDNSALSEGQLLVPNPVVGVLEVADGVPEVPKERDVQVVDEGARIVDVIDVDDNDVVVRIDFAVSLLFAPETLMCAASSLPCPASHLCVLGEGSGRPDHGHASICGALVSAR